MGIHYNYLYPYSSELWVDPSGECYATYFAEEALFGPHIFHSVAWDARIARLYAQFGVRDWKKD